MMISGRHNGETGSIRKNHRYPRIYRLRMRFMFNSAASAVRENPRVIVELKLCLFIALARQSMVKSLGLATAK